MWRPRTKKASFEVSVCKGCNIVFYWIFSFCFFLFYNTFWMFPQKNKDSKLNLNIFLRILKHKTLYNWMVMIWRKSIFLVSELIKHLASVSQAHYIVLWPQTCIKVIYILIIGDNNGIFHKILRIWHVLYQFLNST